MELDPRYPEITPEQRRDELAAKEMLLAEASGDGAASG
jgi:hypothetical protein